MCDDQYDEEMLSPEKTRTASIEQDENLPAAENVLCDIADCERSDLVQRVREMKREVEDSVNEVARLWNYIDQQELQVRVLTDQLRDLGRSRSQLATNASANTSHAQGTVDFSQCDPHMLIAIANKMLREQNRQQVFCGHSSEFALVEYMRTAALPVLEPYTGSEKQSFKRFVNDFTIRKALVTFETLPNEVKQGCFEEVIQAMKDRLSEEGNAARVKAIAQLRNLTIRPDQSVEEFCVALEALANKAYPDVPVEIVSSEELEKTKGLFGLKSMTSIRMIEVEVKALLDTGSEMSIIPVKVFKKLGEKASIWTSMLPRSPE
ncbi:unnamed protein product [Heligmosomoides polygyrus]|uniref:Peptidase A2 domain-containing protein n=1 Tax=Heligmosomoides polygyrus TaxID=6339 RepID=A0A183FRR7_HELPZ|nr:unnamed protein product [Heligmosomoides polygyrus]